MGTLSKTLGALGGFVAGPARFIELLVNRARPYIFTTAPTPADAAAGLAAVGVLRSAEGEALRARLSAHVARVSASLGHVAHPSPIVPIVIGEEDRAVAASAALLAEGLWVPAIRPPTVPAGTSRLRVTLSAAHTDEQVDRLISGLGASGCREPPAGAGAGAAGSAGDGGRGERRDGRGRPDRIALICGTGTEVGKTWVASKVIEELRSRGRSVAARKPAQSFDIDARGRPHGWGHRRRGPGSGQR